MKYFTEKELAAKDTGICKLSAGFGDRMDALREEWGKPLIVNSCCRTKQHNKAIGGSPKSLHVYDEPYHPTGGTCACDFRLMPTTEENEKFAHLALDMGFSVSYEKGCIHVDDRTRVLGIPKIRFIWD
jgi:hypothetical protein